MGHNGATARCVFFFFFLFFHVDYADIYNTGAREEATLSCRYGVGIFAITIVAEVLVVGLSACRHLKVIFNFLILFCLVHAVSCEIVPSHA